MGAEGTSVLRGSLDHLADRLAKIKAEEDAVRKWLKAREGERHRIPKVITQLKHQIRIEEDLDTIKGIEAASDGNYKYKVSMNFNDDESPSKTAKKKTNEAGDTE